MKSDPSMCKNIIFREALIVQKQFKSIIFVNFVDESKYGIRSFNVQKYYFWESVDRSRTIQINNFRKFRKFHQRVKDGMKSSSSGCKNIIFGKALIVREQFKSIIFVKFS